MMTKKNMMMPQDEEEEASSEQPEEVVTPQISAIIRNKKREVKLSEKKSLKNQTFE